MLNPQQSSPLNTSAWSLEIRNPAILRTLKPVRSKAAQLGQLKTHRDLEGLLREWGLEVWLGLLGFTVQFRVSGFGYKGLRVKNLCYSGAFAAPFGAPPRVIFVQKPGPSRNSTWLLSTYSPLGPVAKYP